MESISVCARLQEAGEGSAPPTRRRTRSPCRQKRRLRALLLLAFLTAAAPVSAVSVAAVSSSSSPPPPPLPPPPVSASRVAAAASFSSAPVTVYNFSTDSCVPRPAGFMPPRACVPDIERGCDPDVPDACTRAWAAPRGAAPVRMFGSVNLVSRAQTGPRLADLTHDCASPPYANATRDANDPDLAHFRGSEWLEAPVVGDDGVVYALAHVDQLAGSAYLYTAITLFASQDGGATFAPARAPPAHLVAASPYNNSNGALGAGIGWGMPSSVLRDAASGLYYVLLLANWGKDVGAQAGGLCLARTAAIADPSSWRAWAGPAAGFSATINASPLLGPVPYPAAHACAPLRDAAGDVLTMRHLSLLWSAFFGRFLLFGEAQPGSATGPTGGWAFTLSDDLLTWDVPITVDPAGFINPNGTGAARPISPMPGAFVTVAGVPEAGTWWAAPGGGFKSPVGACEPCPGLDACRNTTVLTPPEFSALPNATFGFSCGLVYATSGYIDYVYSVLVDDTAHLVNGSDPSYNSVGEDAYLFLVAKTCAGATFSRGVVGCEGLDPRGVDRRDIVRATVHFAAAAATET